MNNAWFDPMVWSWVPGTLLGAIGGVMGALCGTLAPQGKAKGLVLGAWYAILLTCAVLLVLSIVAFFSGQPYGVWYGLGLPGVIGLVVMGSLLPVVKLRYRQAEERKMQAQDLE